MTAAAQRAAERFLGGPVAELERVGGGHIHESWRCTGASANVLLVQRLNTGVFPRVDLVMDNVQRVTTHLGLRLAAEAASDRARRALEVVPTREGAPVWTDPEGASWRAYRFIPGCRTLEHAATPAQAHAAGRAFGAFQARLADYTGPRLHDTLPGFHDTMRRLAALARAVAEDPVGRAAAAGEAIDTILEEGRRPATGDAMLAVRELPERIAHNDAKLANVLFDSDTGEALCVIDLDTVMPGLAVHDFGDMARSMTGTAPEDATERTPMTVSLTHFEALARGYLGAAAFLTVPERHHLVTAALTITLEQSARFLTDFLEGDRYYRTDRPDHNLVRARAQWALYASMREAEPALRRLTT